MKPVSDAQARKLMRGDNVLLFDLGRGKTRLACASGHELVRRRLGHAVRRQANVAVGGGMWLTVVRSVLRAMTLRIGRTVGRVTISGTLEEGIARVFEKRSSLTPKVAEIRDDVRALHEALDVAAPEIATDLAS